MLGVIVIIVKLLVQCFPPSLLSVVCCAHGGKICDFPLAFDDDKTIQIGVLSYKDRNCS